MSLYLGLISGTSMDGIDAALVDIDEKNISVVEFLTFPYPDALHRQLHEAIKPDFRCTLHEFATLDAHVGRCFAEAANALLAKASVSAEQVEAIGSHGQTVRHSPETDPPYSLQIGNGAVIAVETAITTVCDFRSLDVAAGGEGAPLVPAFHEWVFRTEEEDRVVVNIGGISNVTVLPADPDKPILGFDTGPGNCLLDDWMMRTHDEPFDRDGAFARAGAVKPALLESLLTDIYFAEPIPKSTGREYFNETYVLKHLDEFDVIFDDADVQATLLELTASSIAKSVEKIGLGESRLIVCGGGAYNPFLLERIAHHYPGIVEISGKYGVEASKVEAACFAWLAQRRIAGLPVKLTTAVAAREKCLGAVYPQSKETAAGEPRTHQSAC